MCPHLPFAPLSSTCLLAVSLRVMMIVVVVVVVVVEAKTILTWRFSPGIGRVRQIYIYIYVLENL